jgi:DNA-binding NtrC family response regulator
MAQASVLLVDPDQTLVGPIRQALEGQPYALRLAGSVAHAREALGQGDIDVVLLSLALPPPGALPLIGEIAADPSGPVVVAVTAPGGGAAGFAARASGAWDYLEPPAALGRERLLTTLANAIERRALRRRSSAARGTTTGALNLEALERQAILDALTSTRWNKQAAARLLGLHRPTLYAKMRKHGIPQARPQ